MQFAEIKLGRTGDPVKPAMHPPVQVIAFTGGKGGIGKSSIALNVAQALSSEGQRTLLLDADLGMANIDALLGLEVDYTLHDVLNGSKSLGDILTSGPGGLRLIPAASGEKQLAELGMNECTGLMRAFSDLDEPIDALVIDTATGISEIVTSFCRAATDIVVVVCNEPASIRDAVALIDTLYRAHGIARFHVLPNMVASATEAGELFAWLFGHFHDNHDMVLSCCGYVPRDECLQRAIAQRQTVLSAFPRSRSAMALNNLARQIMKWPRQRYAGGHLEFFVERLIQNENSDMEVRS
ncbi:MAG: P-loop NTPase [Gammaproteobacteria bacterium]